MICKGHFLVLRSRMFVLFILIITIKKMAFATAKRALEYSEVNCVAPSLTLARFKYKKTRQTGINVKRALCFHSHIMLHIKQRSLQVFTASPALQARRAPITTTSTKSKKSKTSYHCTVSYGPNVQQKQQRAKKEEINKRVHVLAAADGTAI